ncbi:MAG: ribosomal protein L7/L12 [Phycisphaerae bacterium]|jgi:ribosomal protein L7/L12|nr:ribosomal protein L7/L12 [Phycisphaerae bacterium]
MRQRLSVSICFLLLAMGCSEQKKEADTEQTESTTFDVVITAMGQRKIQAVKSVREVTRLGLKDAKNLVDNVPSTVKKGVTRPEAEAIAKTLKEADLTVEIRPHRKEPHNAMALESNYEAAEVYTRLRNQALQLEPGAIGLSNTDQSDVIAVLMETGYPEAVATLVAIADGAASLYFSNGGGIVGAGEYEPVRQASKTFIKFSQGFVTQAALTEAFPLPQKGNVRVYLVTGGGVYTFKASEDDLGGGRHACSALFHKGHELIAAIRKHTPE